MMKSCLTLILLVLNSLFSFEVTDKNLKNKVLVTPTSFRKFADFVLFDGAFVQENFDPDCVFEGAVIFVNPNNLARFFALYHPAIKNRYILLTSVGGTYSPGKWEEYLGDSKIIAWFGRNPSVKNHKKFYPIPIGMSSRLARPRDNPGKNKLPKIEKFQKLSLNRKHFVYLNFNIDTNPPERQLIYDLFSHKNYCFSSSRVPMKKYFRHLKQSVFVLSPKGNGLDCFRTWEALYLGAIPVVRTSKLDSLYKNLPVVVIDDWTKVNKKFLKKRHKEIEARSYSLKKLYIFYWKNLIKKILKKEGIERNKPFKNGT